MPNEVGKRENFVIEIPKYNTQISQYCLYHAYIYIKWLPASWPNTMPILLQSRSIQTSFDGGHHRHQGRQPHGPKNTALRRCLKRHAHIVSLLRHTSHIVGRQHITHLLTPRSRVLLGNLIFSQLVKKLPAFYGTSKFIATFTSFRHLPLSWGRSIQSTLPIPIPEDLT